MFSIGQEKPSEKRSFTRRDFLSTGLKASAVAFTTNLLPTLHVHAEDRHNVLFIIVDDLRPLLGCYGYPQMHTPNIDRLAQRGTLFNRAYCQFPVCNPSRASILTGLRPDTNGVQDNNTHFRDTVPDVVTLPQHFKNNGYHTRSIGKIVHAPFEDSQSWSIPSWTPKFEPFLDLPSWQSLDVSDDELRDGKVAKHTMESLENLQDEQFFLAVGFYKPHLPFNAPTKYYDLYDTQILEDIPNVVLHSRHEMRVYSDIPSEGGMLPEEKSVELIRGYAAATSYMDAQVGRVLNQLDTLGLTEKTIVILAGDHGFHLGEHGTFAKGTTYEVALHSPLIVSIPEQAHIGANTDALVELVDIYPTLCDACQLPIPTALEGISLVPVVEEPTRTWKTAAFSQNLINNFNLSIRTDQYRYTEWGKSALFGKVLYDHSADPNEQTNIAHLPENEKLVAELSERLKAGWRAALPDASDYPYNTGQLSYDINEDGVVDIQDLILISNNFGKIKFDNPKVDVNNDGRVDIIDLLIVAAHFTDSTNTAAPSKASFVPLKHLDRIEEWITEAWKVNSDINVFQRGIATLEGLLNNVIPKKTVLLPNYPNPFNPETWIPYDLSQDTDVQIQIYSFKGESVRQLKIGFQTAGTYRTQSRAAYWDGRNTTGEPVASGVYFYTLTAGQNITTRKMVMTK